MINSDIVQAIVLSGLQGPSADNTQPWHYTWDGNKLLINYDASRVAGYTFSASSPATLLSLGAALENIDMISSYLGVDANLNLNINKIEKGLPHAEIHFTLIDEAKTNGLKIDKSQQGNPKTNRSKAITEVTSHPVFHRHTNRFSYQSTVLPDEVTRYLSALSQGRAHLSIVRQGKTTKNLSHLVKLAAAIRFQTKEVHEWLGASLRFTEHDVKKADGLDIKTLDLPPGGRIFLKFISCWSRMKQLNKLGLHHLLAQIDSAPVKAAPAMIAITAPQTAQGAVDAGRLLCRVWVYLNAQGIAAHPYYVIADQLARLKAGSVPTELISKVQDIEQQAIKAFALDDDETLHMLLRVGYPKRQPPRSLRLPLEAVFTDISQKINAP